MRIEGNRMSLGVEKVELLDIGELKVRLFCLFVSLAILAASGQCQAGFTSYTSNPSNNSGDWATAVTGLGGTINSNVNFNSHPNSSLVSNFYSVSQGVTLNAVGSWGSVTFGSGPAQTNTSGNIPGEGVHAASNFLVGNAGSKSLTISFNQGVFGAGLGVIDYFANNPSDPLIVRAYTGINATGTLLGTALGLNSNFQQNGVYFMGVADTSNTIRSIVFEYSGANTGDIIGIDDIVFASSANVVPEPTSLVLWSLGLVGITFARRRTRKPQLQ